MEEALGFFRENEVFIYLILGLIAVWQIGKFSQAWRELRSSAFGLEREAAQSRLNRATSLLVFVIILAVTEFALVSYVAPAVPGALPLPTATLDLLSTPTITLEGATPNAATPFPTLPPAENGCIPNQVEISAPQNGETVSAIVEIRGSANIPNFGFYKYETSPVGANAWLTIAAGDEIVRAEKLGDWDTTRLAPGDYQLRLVITDSQGEAWAPCVIQVRVEAPPEE